MTIRVKDVLATARVLEPKERTLLVAELQRPEGATRDGLDQHWFNELEQRIADVARDEETEDAEAAGQALRAELER